MHRLATASRSLSVALTLVLGACSSGDKTGESGGEIAKGTYAPSRTTAIKGVDANLVRTEIGRLVTTGRPEWMTDHQWLHTKQTYKLYNNSPLWLEKEGAGRRVKSLATALTASHGDGLRLDAYPLAEITTALTALKEDKQTPEALAQTDMLLTQAYIALAEDMLTGQVDPRSVTQSWNIDVHEDQLDSAFVRTVRAENIEEALSSMRPRDDDYVFLQAELDRYRELVVKGGWGTVPAGKAVAPGAKDSPARIAALRARLAAEGIVLAAAPAAGGVYDGALAGAVATWQSMHGIGVDSMLGVETLEALNRPAAYRLGQIAANLERLRWMPRSLGLRYLVVNVPAFRVEGYEDGKKAIEMKVIVGADFTDRATPVFSDTMTHVVFRPYWNVTDDIANKELWPKIRANSGYMEANDYETFQESGKTRIRQRPGPKNSLGLVKFMFPNAYNIYLHDTPNQKLFQEDVRAFSHGCIRLEKPAELAQWLLKWDAAKVQAAMAPS